MKRLILFLIMVVSLTVSAQESSNKPLKKLVVADIETRVPIRNVIVSTLAGYRDTTNYRGICYVPAEFDTLTVYKANYIPERLTMKELKDSTYLIPAENAIGQVTVWGKNHIQDNVGNWRKYSPLPDGSTGRLGSFEFSKLFDRRQSIDAKHLRKVREKFREMDKFSDDPIENAYLKAMNDKRLKAERDSLKNQENTDD